MAPGPAAAGGRRRPGRGAPRWAPGGSAAQSGAGGQGAGAARRPLEQRGAPRRNVRWRTYTSGRTDEKPADTYGALKPDRLLKRRFVERADFDAAQLDGEAEKAEEAFPSTSVSPNVPKDIDSQFTSVASDGRTVRYPSTIHRPPVQMWEPFVIAAILSLPYFTNVAGSEDEEALYERGSRDLQGSAASPAELSWHERHVERLLQYTEKLLLRTFPSPLVRQHLQHPALRHQDTRFLVFLSEFLQRKFEPYLFDAPYLFEYIHEALFEARSSPDERTQRIFITSPWVLELLKNTPATLFQGQYQEMLAVMQAVSISLCNVVEAVARRKELLAKSVWASVFDSAPQALDFDHLNVYLDASLIPRRLGGHSLAADELVLSQGDELLLRKVGATLEEIITGRNIVAVARSRGTADAKGGSESSSDDQDSLGGSSSASAAEKGRPGEADEEGGGPERRRPQARAPADVPCIDPEDARFMPLGLSLTQAFLLLEGMALAMDRPPGRDAGAGGRSEGGQPWVLRRGMSLAGHDRHVLAAAVLIDLYMREKVDVWAWELLDDTEAPGASLSACPIANIYRVLSPANAPVWSTELSRKPHWLEHYVPLAEEIFASMELPALPGEEPLWGSLLSRGVLVETAPDHDRFTSTSRMLDLLGQQLTEARRCTQRVRSTCASCWRRARGWIYGNGRAGPPNLTAFYKFEPPLWPQSSHREVARWLAELESRRKAAHDWARCDPSSDALVPHMAEVSDKHEQHTSSAIVSTNASEQGKHKGRTGHRAHRRRGKSPASPSESPELPVLSEPVSSNNGSAMGAADAEAACRQSPVIAEDARHSAAPDKGARRAREFSRPEGSLDCSPGGALDARDGVADGGEGAAECLAWWERLKVLYCDAYLLQFEEGAVYFEGEQEVALRRAQLLMFLFALQVLCEAACEAHDGLGRAVRAACPPFAQLPLAPPRGLEAAGAVVRGLAERAARLAPGAGGAGTAEVLAESGALQEGLRAELRAELLHRAGGASTLDELAAAAARLPGIARLRAAGAPPGTLEALARGLAQELLCLADEDGDGALAPRELRNVVEERHRATAGGGVSAAAAAAAAAAATAAAVRRQRGGAQAPHGHRRPAGSAV